MAILRTLEMAPLMIYPKGHLEKGPSPNDDLCSRSGALSFPIITLCSQYRVIFHFCRVGRVGRQISITLSEMSLFLRDSDYFRRFSEFPLHPRDTSDAMKPPLKAVRFVLPPKGPIWLLTMIQRAGRRGELTVEEEAQQEFLSRLLFLVGIFIVLCLIFFP
mmetsp:Transcript_46626/g.123753  ORF Transcript_46626/g.123753 Transcript_46626/m.123753 type:complete len:161 (-) Transcript_46626:59-541(-)